MVHVVFTNVFDYEDYRQIPYSYDRTVALKYADLFGISKKHVRSVPEKVFLRMVANAADYEEVEEIHEYFKDVYLTETDFQFINSEIDDMVCDMEKHLREVKQMLKFFDCKETKDIVDAIDNLIKRSKKKYERLDLYLIEFLKVKKFIKSYYKEEKEDDS